MAVVMRHESDGDRRHSRISVAR